MPLIEVESINKVLTRMPFSVFGVDSTTVFVFYQSKFENTFNAKADLITSMLHFICCFSRPIKAIKFYDKRVKNY